jgi:hypothetical protein
MDLITSNLRSITNVKIEKVFHGPDYCVPSGIGLDCNQDQVKPGSLLWPNPIRSNGVITRTKPSFSAHAGICVMLPAIVTSKSGKEEHCSLFIVHLSFVSAWKSPNVHRALIGFSAGNNK